MSETESKIEYEKPIKISEMELPVRVVITGYYHDPDGIYGDSVLFFQESGTAISPTPTIVKQFLEYRDVFDKAGKLGVTFDKYTVKTGKQAGKDTYVIRKLEILEKRTEQSKLEVVDSTQ